MSKTPIEILLDQVELKEVENPKPTSDLPYVTHSGILKLGEVEIEVMVLNTGERVISEDSINKLFGITQ